MENHSLDQYENLRSSAVAWAERPWHERLQLIARIAGQIAVRGRELAENVHRPAATAGEILASEVLPVAEACRYVARYGEQILKPQRLSSRGRAWWMGGITVTQSRVPLGIVLIIGPSNYPLLLNAVPMIQALAAGNAVLVKPAPGCEQAMHLMHSIITSAGLPPDLVHVLDSRPEAATQAIQRGVDKVVFTGSYTNGRRVAQLLADHVTPGTFELSGNDVVIVLDQADLQRVAKCVAYGLSLNGGQTCIAPRRLLASPATLGQLMPLLSAELQTAPARAITSRGCEVAATAIDSSLADGARVAVGQRSDLDQPNRVKPIVLSNVRADMPVCREDIFAPVLSTIAVADANQAVELANDCPYALGASVFGPVDQAEEVANRLNAPCVTINDVIVPTADPRVSFGGRGASGYGTTRGLEGLRELTQLKVTCHRQGNWMPHLTTGPEQLSQMMHGILLLRHGQTWSAKWTGLKTVIAAGRAGSTPKSNNTNSTKTQSNA